MAHAPCPTARKLQSENEALQSGPRAVRLASALQTVVSQLGPG